VKKHGTEEGERGETKKEEGEEERRSQAKFICIGPPSLFRAEIQLIGSPGITTRVRVHVYALRPIRPPLPLHRLSASFFPPFGRTEGRKEGRKGASPRSGTAKKSTSTNPIPSVCSGSPFARPSPFLSFCFTSPRASVSSAGSAVDSSRIYFSVRELRAKLSRHAGFKYGQLRRARRNVCVCVCVYVLTACRRRNYKMQKGASTILY